MVAHHREAQRAGQLAQRLGAAQDGSGGEVLPQRAIGDVVAGQQHQVGRKPVDLADHAAYKRWLGVLVEVDVADLGDAVVVEGVGQVGQRHVARDDADLMARELTGIQGESRGGSG